MSWGASLCERYPSLSAVLSDRLEYYQIEGRRRGRGAGGRGRGGGGRRGGAAAGSRRARARVLRAQQAPKR